MKHRMHAFTVGLGIIFLFSIDVYAASGDLVVNGNLTVGGTVNGSKISSAPAPNTVPVSDGNSLIIFPVKNLAMTGEASATSGTATTTLDLGSVTAGDRIDVSATIDVNNYSAGQVGVVIAKSSGTATIIFAHSQNQLSNVFVLGATTWLPSVISVRGVCKVTGSGTLVLKSIAVASGTSPYIYNEIYAFFLKRQ